MYRAKIILVATLLAVLGTLLSIFTALYFSWIRATSTESEYLQSIAQRGIERVQIIFDDAKSALKEAQNLNEASCSETHILRMRAISINTPSIEDIGYFKDGFLKCTSSGKVRNVVAQPQVSFITQDGFSISPIIHPTIADGKSMVSVGYIDYKVLINPIRFVDIAVDSEHQLAITTENGELLSGLHNPDLEQIHNLLKDKGEKHIFSVVSEDNLNAVAIGSDINVTNQLYDEIVVLLPIGVLISALIICAVISTSRKLLSPLGELKLAVEKREFIVHYQPLIEIKTGLCVGAEALVRWQRPDGTMVRPDLFIPLAEESGLVLPITDQVITTVIRDLQEVLEKHGRLHIAINVSAQDLKTERILNVLKSALSNTRISPDQVCLEATESGFMDIKAARTTISKARHTGYAIAIDDFGTGYSSLSYLQSLPLDTLKVDKSFIDTINTECASGDITSHIIGIAKSLGLKIVAEGVETKEQIDYLLEHEVDICQGWLFSKAIPAQEFIKFFLQNIELHQFSRKEGVCKPTENFPQLLH